MSLPTTDQLVIPSPAPVKTGPTADPEVVSFLEGTNPLQYVVNIEVPRNESMGLLTIQAPGEPVRQVKQAYRPFLYIKDLKKSGRPFYGGDAKRRSEAMNKYKITFKKLRVTDSNGAVNERLDNGYCYQVFSDCGRGQQGLTSFFTEGGIGMWESKTRTARFELALPQTAPEPDELYSGLAGQDGCELLYNHVTERYELHIEAKFVNTRNMQDEQGEDDFFIRLKAEGKDVLRLEQDFEYSYDGGNEKYILSLLPEAEKPRKTRKAKDGSLIEVPTLGEAIAALESELLEGVERIDHPLVVARMPEVLPADWDAEVVVVAMREEGIWGKVQDRERVVHLRERKQKMAHNTRTQKKLDVKLEMRKASPSRKANPRDPRYTISKLVVEYNVGYSDFFYQVKPIEQLMIQQGIRLFKGFDRYADIHKLDYDLETTGLFPEKHRIFLIGERDNKGYENVWDPTKLGDDESERQMIRGFLKNLGVMRPAVIKGFNSENFDWDFLEVRCRILGIPFEIPDWYGKTQPIERKGGATLKLGGESEVYTQTLIVGTSVIDVMHAARRVKAVNSDMERYSLKYVCQYKKIAKPNRMYIENGGSIYKLWEANDFFVADRATNAYERLSDEHQVYFRAEQARADYPEGYVRGRNPVGSLVPLPAELQLYGEANSYLTSGRAIVYQYLLDDLWETDKVDDLFNEERFQMAKWMPTSMTRTFTMGGSTAWNLMMTIAHYAHGIAIPYRQKKYSFTGGLSRTFRLGKFKTVEKVDFSGLYPSLKLQYDIFPMHDVLGVRRRYLQFFTETRGIYKTIANNDSLPHAERTLADARSGPLKINNNSEFGSGGSFFDYWNYIEGAWETTCRGRQFLRGMVTFFMRYGCKATILDTDGVNFEVPDDLTVDLQGNPVAEPYSIKQLTYTNRKGKVFTGFASLVAKYNDDILGDKPYMKLDLEAYWPSAINISRKNYANLEAQKDPNEPPKIKFVGNSIKDNNMPAYIKQFIQKGLRLLLNDEGHKFVEYYYQHLTKIYLMQIPLKDIAKKGKVKMTAQQYLNRGTNKNGGAKARQAHMELIIQENLKVDLGDAVYFVATGKKKTETESTIDKATGKLMASVYSEAELERDPKLTVEYNVERYVEAFNAKVKLLLVVFNQQVRDTLLKTNPAERNHFTESELELISYENPKDPLSEFFQMEASEVKFWNLSGLDPYEMFADFSTSIPYDGFHYAHKLKGVQRVLQAQGRRVRCYRERYENGDLVLGFERTVYVRCPQTGEQTEVPKYIHPYMLEGVGSENGLPYDNATYRELRHYRLFYGVGTQIVAVRRYPLSEVVQGELVLQRVLHDAPPKVETGEAVAA
jgi:DNA polymerase elongation subunit (family B)